MLHWKKYFLVLDLANIANLFSSHDYHQIIKLAVDSEFRSQTNPLVAQIVAASYFRVGDFQSSLNLLEEIESSFDGDPSFWSLYGITCRRLGDLDRAAIFLKKSIDLDPNSLAHKNNYSNLLIDLGKLDEALDLLQQIIAVDPNYVDAVDNLNRAKFLLSNNIPTDNSDFSSQDLSRKPNDQTTCITLASSEAFPDPLMAAFSDNEVEIYGRIKKHISNDSSTALLSKLPTSKDQELGLEALKMARKAFQEEQFQLSLKMCSKALMHLGPNPSIYDVSSDCLISLKKFASAELCLLHAVALSTPTSKQYINLVTLAMIRGDLSLSRHYLNLAAGVDPHNPNLPRLNKQISDNASKQKYQAYHFSSFL